MNVDWMELIRQCQAQELPVVPMPTEPWFSATFVCGTFLCIERSDKFVADWKRLKLPVIRIRNHPLIRFSDVEKYGQAMTAEAEASEPPKATKKRV